MEKAKSVLERLDKCCDKSDEEHVKLRCTTYSYIGNAYLELNDLQQALKYHQKDYNLAKKQQVYSHYYSAMKVGIFGSRLLSLEYSPYQCI